MLIYTSPEEDLRVSYPRDWVPQERFMGTVVAFFFSPLDGQSDLFRENVNLVTDSLDRPVTVEQHTQASLRPLAQVIARFELIEEGEGTLADRPARFNQFTGRQGGVELTWLQLLPWRERGPWCSATPVPTSTRTSSATPCGWPARSSSPPSLPLPYPLPAQQAGWGDPTR